MLVHYTWQKQLTPSLLAAPASAQRALRAREYETRRFPAGRSRRPTAEVPVTGVQWPGVAAHTRVPGPSDGGRRRARRASGEAGNRRDDSTRRVWSL